MLELEQIATVGDELALAWKDGQESYLPCELLRRACPCASCQGEPDAMGRVARPQVDYGEGSFQLTRYQVVGGYALQLFWLDGHNTGIYSYEYLRKLGGAEEETRPS
jgi:DUF971 family protein